MALCALSAQAQTGSPGCSSQQQANYPKATISNGQVEAVLYLPDAKNGYYRASRFDWSGVIPCLAYKGHTYFGIWFPHYDPLLADAIAGPVEEFRSSDGALDYGQAKPGELFVKLGVGVLRKKDDSAYQFMYPYPLVDGGKWTIHARPSEVSFRQQLQSPIGIAYDYEKTVKLDPHEPVLILEHRLKNTGTKTIDTEVYDHDFFMLDGAPSGPGMSVRFGFEPKAEKSLEPLAGIDGKQIVYHQELKGAVRGKLSHWLFQQPRGLRHHGRESEDGRRGRANRRRTHVAFQLLVPSDHPLPRGLYSPGDRSGTNGALEHPLSFLRQIDRKHESWRGCK